jgi:hypothetical protein
MVDKQIFSLWIKDEDGYLNKEYDFFKWLNGILTNKKYS